MKHRDSNPPSFWRSVILNFSWQWHSIVMATTVTSALVHSFPYSGSPALRVVALVLFFVGLVVFLFNNACLAARAILRIKSLELVTKLRTSQFSGFFVVAAAGLIQGALNANKDWGTGNAGFLYTLWAFWWIDACLAFIIAFGTIHLILGEKPGNMYEVTASWIVPVVTLVTMSTCGGLMAQSLAVHSHMLALVTSVFALTMGIIGLSITTMITWSVFLRLFLYGAPDATAVCATLTTLTPLGQGGFALLVNGKVLSKLVPVQLDGELFPQRDVVGQTHFAICICLAYILWCMGLAWIILSLFVIARRARKLPRFCIIYWSIVFPNGVFALCSLGLGDALNSRFFRGFGAAWCILVFTLWTALFLRSIPAFLDGTLFLSPPEDTSSDDDDAATLSPANETGMSTSQHPFHVV